MRAITSATFVVLSAIVVHASQSQDVAQQTNGRGAIGINCNPEANGCRIRRITKEGPAERAGLRVGDLLLPLNPSDQAVVTAQIGKNAPGTKIVLPVQRGSERIQVPLTVEDQLAIALRGSALADAVAEEALGSIYRNGVGVPKNPAEALQWTRKAAEQSYDMAEFDLGRMYENGEGVQKDDAAAAEWYRKAAEQGFTPAERILGDMYALGHGVTQDGNAAVEWFRRAAEQGFAPAENDLGQAYADGLGVARDYKAAAEWYRKAAEQGDSVAQYNLAWCYENGRGVPKDVNVAADWYSKAAAQGVERAKQRLAALRR